METSGATIGEIGEHAVIARIRRNVPPAPAWVTVGIGDDAAVLTPERNRSEVITTDVLVEGVHFDRTHGPPTAIGHKALAVNLSDLAAMGAEPRAALLSLVLPGGLAVADLDEIVDGLLALASRHGVALVGGNVARSPGPMIVEVTATGSVKPRRVLRRRGARAGDDLYVSGSIGAAAAGLQVLAMRGNPAEAGSHEAQVQLWDRASALSCTGDAREGAGDAGEAECVQRFLMPEPRVRLGLLLGRSGIATACVDLSDGLADGVRQIAAASRVGASIEADAVPVLPAARAVLERRHAAAWFDAAASGGEDYELLFTAPPRRRRALAAVLRQAAGLPCTRIGRVTADRKLLVLREGRSVPLPGGFAHFR